MNNKDKGNRRDIISIFHFCLPSTSSSPFLIAKPCVSLGNYPYPTHRWDAPDPIPNSGNDHVTLA